jgi:phage terminase large subunit GpA-like protein
MAVDVQKNRLIFTKRGWGAYGTSCLIEAGEIFGDTSEEHIWNDLASEMTEYVYGMPIRLVLIDSGFRPGKKDAVPDHRVYEFCRRFPNLARATKGSSTPMRKPIVASQIDIKLNGREFKKGLHLLRLDGDHFKSAVHAKVRWPEGAPGAFYLPTDVSEDYCMQLVSEARVKTPNGKVKWVQRARENHFLDIEAMQEAAGMLLNVRTLRGETPQKPRRMRQDGEYAPPETIPDPDNRDRDRRPERRQGWLPRESIWR